LFSQHSQKINYDCAIQRGPVWKQPQKSLYINSILNNYPIPPFFFAKHKNSKKDMYDGLDGKQRTTTVIQFLNDEFALDDNFITSDRDDKEHDFSNLKYSELPDWAKDEIKNHTIQFYYFEDITEDQYDEIFYRLNNGTPLAQIEKTRVKAPSLRLFQEIAKHDLINTAVTDKGRVRYDHENLVMQAWGICFAFERDDFSFETAKFRKIIEEAEASEVESKTLLNCFTILYNIFNAFALDEATAKKKAKDLTEDEKIRKSITTRIKRKVHLVALTRAIMVALEHDYEIERLIDWVKALFGDKKYTTSCREYNLTTSSGSAKRETVYARITAITNHLHGFMWDSVYSEVDIDEDDDVSNEANMDRYSDMV